MEIQLTVKNGELTDEVQQTLRQKVSKLPRYFDRTTGVQIRVDQNNSPESKVELVVSAEETKDFFASDTGSNVIVACDKALSKVEQQLRRHKEKITGHRG